VDCEQLTTAQKACDLIAAESCLQEAFATDVRPVIREWRVSKGLPQDPMAAFRESGYLERISLERAARNTASAGSYA
jgi:L-rhamnose isomerase/sugar isomerase